MNRSVLVVPGTGATDAHGRHAITRSTRLRLRIAERTARRVRPVAVILSGFDGWTGGPSEAEQMFAIWRGPRDVPVLLDEAARSTAENAICAMELVTAIGEIDQVHVVTPWWNAWRIGIFFLQAARRTGVRVRLRVAMRGGPHLRMALLALSGLPHLRRHWRQGRAYLVRGPRHPVAIPCRAGGHS